MSGSAYNIEYIDNGQPTASMEEAAGKVGTAITNAFVNKSNTKSMKKLAAQQQAALADLRARDTAVYNQRLGVAGQILGAADRLDPDYFARLRSNDIANTESVAADQAARNIAISQGGLGTGQQKAYGRNAALTIAKDRALAFNKGLVDATNAQNNMRFQGAGLLGPNEAAFQNLTASNEIGAAKQRAQAEANQSTWGGFASALSYPEFGKSTSPDPSAASGGGGGFGDILASFGKVF